MSVGYALRRMLQSGLSFALWGLVIGGGVGLVAGGLVPQVNDLIGRFMPWAFEIGANVSNSITEDIGKALGEATAGLLAGGTVGPVAGFFYGMFYGLYYSDL